MTLVSATHGNAVLGSGNAVTYTAPASGPDTISYTVKDQHGDTASGQVAVTVDAGPTAGSTSATEAPAASVKSHIVDSRADHAGDSRRHRDADERQRDARQRGAWFRQRGDLHGAGERD